jgi:hypothetical protein
MRNTMLKIVLKTLLCATLDWLQRVARSDSFIFLGIFSQNIFCYAISVFLVYVRNKKC